MRDLKTWRAEGIQPEAAPMMISHHQRWERKEGKEKRSRNKWKNWVKGKTGGNWECVEKEVEEEGNEELDVKKEYSVYKHLKEGIYLIYPNSKTRLKKQERFNMNIMTSLNITVRIEHANSECLFLMTEKERDLLLLVKGQIEVVWRSIQVLNLCPTQNFLFSQDDWILSTQLCITKFLPRRKTDR